MARGEQPTVNLPNEMIRDIDRREEDSDKFVAEAVRAFLQLVLLHFVP
jgi:hypothetical protein